MLSPCSRVQLCVILWTAAHQAPLSMGVSRQEHWSGLPWPPPEDLPDPEVEPTSFMSPELTGGFLTTNATWEAQYTVRRCGRIQLSGTGKDLGENHLSDSYKEVGITLCMTFFYHQ